VLPGSPVGALATLPRSLSLPPAPSRCPPGPVVARSRLPAARAPPPSSVMQQRRRPSCPPPRPGPPLSSPLPSLHVAPTMGTPCLSSLSCHQAAIKGANRRPFPFLPRPSFVHARRISPTFLISNDARHYSRALKPLSPQQNRAKASSSSPPPMSFAFRMPLSLLLHGGRCLTFLSLSPPWRKTRSHRCWPLRALHRRRTPPRRAAPSLHRCVTVSSESMPRLHARWLALLTVMLPPKTLPRLDLCSDGAGHAKAPPRTWPLRGDHGTERVVRAAGHRLGQPPRWAKSRQQASAPPAPQAATPEGPRPWAGFDPCAV
jgi:hypothetical protein